MMTKAFEMYDKKYYTKPISFEDAMKMMAFDEILLVKCAGNFYHTQFIDGRFRLRKYGPSHNWKFDDSSSKFWRHSDNQFYAPDMEWIERDEKADHLSGFNQALNLMHLYGKECVSVHKDGTTTLHYRMNKGVLECKGKREEVWTVSQLDFNSLNAKKWYLNDKE